MRVEEENLLESVIAIDDSSISIESAMTGREKPFVKERGRNFASFNHIARLENLLDRGKMSEMKTIEAMPIKVTDNRVSVRVRGKRNVSGPDIAVRVTRRCNTSLVSNKVP